MPNIQQRGENSWFFTVYTGKQANGRYGRETMTLTVEDEALLRTKKKLQDHLEMEYAKFKAEVQAGTYIAPDKILSRISLRRSGGPNTQRSTWRNGPVMSMILT